MFDDSFVMVIEVNLTSTNNTQHINITLITEIIKKTCAITSKTNNSMYFFSFVVLYFSLKKKTLSIYSLGRIFRSPNFNICGIKFSTP